MRRTTVAVRAFTILFLLVSAAQAAPQQESPPPPAQTGALLQPQQLDDLVAPIALYPDPLVAQLLAAATYPIEIAEAEQWVQDHHHWSPSKLMDKAKKENWDPSVQGLVAFPQVLEQLSQDINWTTQLGNAFLAQQADVMQAVQRMRSQAESRGTLHSTPQETVSTQDQGGQQVITIQPANPDVWYVPNYNPAYVWGPPAWGAYPPLLYPGIGVGLGWWPGIDIGLSFGGWGGWGWGGWGWTPNWYGGGIYLDHSFFNRYGFHGYGGWGGYGNGGYLGRSMWMHNPEHRMGVPYANRAVAQRFGGGEFGGGRGLGGGRAFGGEANRFGGPAARFNRSAMPAQQHFGSPAFEQRSWAGNHSVFGGYHNGGMARMQSDRGFSSMGAGRTFGGFHGGGFGGGMRGGGFGGGMRGGGGFHGGGRR